MTQLGYYERFGDQIRVYTLRGWVLCDDMKELREEINEINKHLKELDDARKLKKESIKKES